MTKTQREKTDTHLRVALERHAATAPWMVFSYARSGSEWSLGPFPQIDGDRGEAEARATARNLGSERYFAAIPNYL